MKNAANLLHHTVWKTPQLLSDAVDWCSEMCDAARFKPVRKLFHFGRGLCGYVRAHGAQ